MPKGGFSEDEDNVHLDRKNVNSGKLSDTGTKSSKSSKDSEQSHKTTVQKKHKVKPLLPTYSPHKVIVVLSSDLTDSEETKENKNASSVLPREKQGSDSDNFKVVSSQKQDAGLQPLPAITTQHNHNSVQPESTNTSNNDGDDDVDDESEPCVSDEMMVKGESEHKNVSLLQILAEELEEAA